jgi:uncharacterized protein involved in exopolysaccharide biosynthesis
MGARDDIILLDEPERAPLPPAESPPPESPMATTLHALVRFRWMIALLVAAGAAVGFVFASLRPETYESAGKVLVRIGEREQGTPDTALAEGRAIVTRTVREDVQNELHFFQDPELYRSVAAEVGAHRILRVPLPMTDPSDAETPPLVRRLRAIRAGWIVRFVRRPCSICGEAYSCDACVLEATRELHERTTIRNEPNSSVISVSYSGPTPEAAKRVVDSFLRAFLERHRQVFATDPALEFLESQVEGALAGKANAEAALVAHQSRCGIYDLEKEGGKVLEEIAEVDAQIAADRQRLTDLTARKEHLRGIFEKESPEDRQIVGQTMIANPLYGGLLERLHQLQRERADLLAHFRPDTPYAKSREEYLSREIRRFEEELRREQPVVEGGHNITIVSNAAYHRLRAQLEDIESEEEGIRHATVERKQRLGELRRRHEAIRQCEVEHAALQFEAERRRKQVSDFAQARDRASVLNLLDQVKMSNLRVIQGATLPFEPDPRNRFKLAGIGLTLGLFFGAGLAVLLQTLGRTVRRPHDVERILGARILHVVPDVSGYRIRRRPASGATERDA